MFKKERKTADSSGVEKKLNTQKNIHCSLESNSIF